MKPRTFSFNSLLSRTIIQWCKSRKADFLSLSKFPKYRACSHNRKMKKNSNDVLFLNKIIYFLKEIQGMDLNSQNPDTSHL